jgi:hypothetical protein
LNGGLAAKDNLGDAAAAVASLSSKLDAGEETVNVTTVGCLRCGGDGDLPLDG